MWQKIQTYKFCIRQQFGIVIPGIFLCFINDIPWQLFCHMALGKGASQGHWKRSSRGHPIPTRRGSTSKPATCGKKERGGVSRWDSRVLGIPFPSLEAKLGGLLNKPPDKQGGLWNISGSITAHTLDWGRGSREIGESRGFIRQPGLPWLLRM